MIRQGEIYWIPANALMPSVPGEPHPHIVIQPDALNASRIATTVVCALTSNLARASEPGNLLLDDGEGGLPRRSVAVVSQISTVDKARLAAPIGALSAARIEQIFDGMRFLERAFFARD